MAKRKSPEGLAVRLTPKGIAYYLACKHGLCAKVKGGYDTAKFDKFWNEFERALAERREEIDAHLSGDLPKSDNDSNENNRPHDTRSYRSFWSGFSLAMAIAALVINVIVIFLK